MALSTVSGVLTRIGMGKLGATGLGCPLNAMNGPAARVVPVHIDVKKLGRIQGGAAAPHGLAAAPTNKRARYDTDGDRHYTVGWEYVHIAIDGCTKPAYAELAHTDRVSTPRPSASFAEPELSTAPRDRDPQRCRNGGASILLAGCDAVACRRTRQSAARPPGPSALDQRQGGALHPHHARRLGRLRRAPPQLSTAHCSPDGWLWH